MDNGDESPDADADSVLRKIRVEATSAIMSSAEPDAELLEILVKRIVVPSPDADAIKRTMADIHDLVDERARN